MTVKTGIPFYIPSKKLMDIVLLITNHCDACTRAKEQLKTIQKRKPNINAEVRHINSYSDDRIFITPAWIVDGQLFAYGDINKDKLIEKIN